MEANDDLLSLILTATVDSQTELQVTLSLENLGHRRNEDGKICVTSVTLSLYRRKK